MSESKVKVAAIQAAPVFLDLEASLQKALALIEKAAANGATLLVFPEAFLPAWPAWVDEVLPGEDAAWHVRLLEQSVVVPGPVTEQLGAAARQAGVYLVMGVDEREEHGGTVRGKRACPITVLPCVQQNDLRRRMLRACRQLPAEVIAGFGGVLDVWGVLAPELIRGGGGRQRSQRAVDDVDPSVTGVGGVLAGHPDGQIRKAVAVEVHQRVPDDGCGPAHRRDAQHADHARHHQHTPSHLHYSCRCPIGTRHGRPRRTLLYEARPLERSPQLSGAPTRPSGIAEHHPPVPSSTRPPSRRQARRRLATRTRGGCSLQWDPDHATPSWRRGAAAAQGTPQPARPGHIGRTVRPSGRFAPDSDPTTEGAYGTSHRHRGTVLPRSRPRRACPLVWRPSRHRPGAGDLPAAAVVAAAGPDGGVAVPADTDDFGRPEQAWMLNLRVRDLDAMIAQLRAAGIEVTLDPQAYPNGRFASTADPEGNPIQLWEPTSDALQEPPDFPTADADPRPTQTG